MTVLGRVGRLLGVGNLAPAQLENRVSVERRVAKALELLKLCW